MCGLHGGNSLGRRASPILNSSESTHKLLALPERDRDSTADQKSLCTTAEGFPAPPAPALCALALHPCIITIRHHHQTKPHTSGGTSIPLRSETYEDDTGAPCPPPQGHAGACAALRTSPPDAGGDTWPCTSLGPRCARTGSPLRTPGQQISCREGFLLRSCSAQGSSSRRGLTRGVAGEQRFASNAHLGNTSRLTWRKKEGKRFPQIKRNITKEFKNLVCSLFVLTMLNFFCFSFLPTPPRNFHYLQNTFCRSRFGFEKAA